MPHIGTFGEVVRTSMVRHAFEVMTGAKTRLVCFSDDMDGLRKVPDNVPNGEAMQADLGLPLTAVRDPFGTHPSFGAHNNARLQAFLDSFGFDYEFVSSTDCYTSGRFDDGLRAVLAHYDKIMDIINEPLPSDPKIAMATVQYKRLKVDALDKRKRQLQPLGGIRTVSYTHLRAHETV